MKNVRPMIYGAAVALLLLLAAKGLRAQPYYQWNTNTATGGHPAIQAEAVYVDNNGNIQAVDLYGSGGQLTVNIPAATGRAVHLIPAFSTFSGGAVLWQGQAATQQNHQPGINVQINPQQAQPVVAAPALQAVGGYSWTFYVKWTQQTINDAQAKGITGPLYFNVGVFPASKKRTDAHILGNSHDYAQQAPGGAAHVTVQGLKAFDPVRECRVEVIIGGKVTGMPGNNGKKYTATCSERIWTDTSGTTLLKYWDDPSTLNYVTIAPVSWTFTEE